MKSRRVCDVGCGTGLFLPLLAAAVGRRGTVVGVDPSAGFVQLSKDRVAAAGLANVASHLACLRCCWPQQSLAYREERTSIC